MANLDLSSLNPVQRQAVTWEGGPLLVLAGPGSGKTRVLTTRAAWLLQNSAGKRFRLLALTFTVKAANEMKERLDSMLNGEKDRARVSTFHAFAAELLRQHGSHLGLAPNFEIVSDDSERRSLLKGILRQIEPGQVYEADESRLLGLVDIYTERGWDATTAGRHLRDNDLARFVDEIATRYVTDLISRNVLDFPTIIGLASRTLKAFPGVARQVHIAYSHILVDEFQDTNRAQFELLTALVGPNKENLFVVGDDDQIIYQWNGASPRRIDDLKREFGASVLQLPTNFRCPPSIVQLANDLITHNVSRTESKEPLVAARPEMESDAVEAKAFQALDEELDWIAQDIKNRGCRPEETVLLCRSNRLAKVAVDRLNANGVPCAQPKRKTDFDSPGVRLIVNVLKAANSPATPEHIERIAASVYDLTSVRLDLETTKQRALEVDSQPLAILLQTLSVESTEPILKELSGVGVSALVEQNDSRRFVSESLGALTRFYSQPSSGEVAQFEGFDEDKAILQEATNSWVRRYGQNGSLASFVQELQLSPKVAPLPKNSTLCLTVHTSKGLEFKHVYLFGMVESQFPSYQAIRAGDSSTEMEEERRNCFVAVTRASSSLTVTWASAYFGYKCSPSRFLREMRLM